MSKSELDGVLVERLKEKFGLNADPFSGLNKAFFEGAQRQHNVETLRHLSIFGDMVLLLTGDKGAGKTTLISRFIAEHGSEINAVLFSAQPNAAGLSPVERLAKIAGLSNAGKDSAANLVARLLETYESQFQTSGKRVVWIIDDAEHIPKPELEVLLGAFKNLAPESGVVLLLCGLPGLVDELVSERDLSHEEWVHQVQLKPFTKDETLEYLILKLRSVGFEGDLDLSYNQIEHLVLMGKGLPGRLNRLFGTVVLGAGTFKPANPKPEASLGQKVLFALAGVLVISFLMVSYQYGIFDTLWSEDVSVNSDEATDGMNGSAEEQSSLQADAALEAQQKRLAMLDAALGRVTNGESNEQVDNIAESGEIESISGEASAIEKKESSAAEDGLEEKGQQKVLVADSPLAQSSLEGGASVEGVTKIESTIKTTKEQPQQIPVEKVVKQTSVNEVESQKSRESSEVDVSSADEPNVVNPSDNRYDANIYRPKAWVAQQPGTDYAYQVLGSYNESTALGFIERAGLNAKELYYVKTLYKGKAWFVVLYGQYQSRPSANKALQAAPDIIRKQKPWLRSFTGILASYP